MTRVNNIVSGIKYSLYLIVHPFKGFWDLKHEKKGNLGAALSLVAMVMLTFIFEAQFSGFLFNYTNPAEFNIWMQLTGTLLPFILWCVSNWCITTLMDGEGTFKDIIIVSAYALTPLLVLRIPAIILSNIFSLNESGFYIVIIVLSIIWTGALFIVGIMTVHQFTMGKTLVTILIALVGMIVMLFLFVLFFALIQQVVNFIILIKKELDMR